MNIKINLVVKRNDCLVLNDAKNRMCRLKFKLLTLNRWYLLCIIIPQGYVLCQILQAHNDIAEFPDLWLNPLGGVTSYKILGVDIYGLRSIRSIKILLVDYKCHGLKISLSYKKLEQ